MVERLQPFPGLLAVGGKLCRRSFSVLAWLTSSFPPRTCKVASGHFGEDSSSHAGLRLSSQAKLLLEKSWGGTPVSLGGRGNRQIAKGEECFSKPLKYLEGRKLKEAVIAM